MLSYRTVDGKIQNFVEGSGDIAIDGHFLLLYILIERIANIDIHPAIVAVEPYEGLHSS